MVNSDSKDSKIKVIVDATGCEQQEAEEALAAADGDVNRAVDIINRITRNYMVLKLYAEGRRSVKLRMLIFLLANGISGELKKVSVFATYENVPADTLTVEADWQSFYKTVEFLHKDSIPEYGIEGKVTNYIWKALSPSLVNKFFRSARNKDISFIQAFFADSIRKITEEEVAIQLSVQLVNVEDIKRSEKLEEEEKKEEQKEEPQEEKGDSTLYLRCMPVIDPVVGVSVDALMKGERLVVKLVDTTPLGTVIKQFFNNNPVDENGDPIIVAPVRKVELSKTGRPQVIVEIGRGILGKLIVDENFKLKVADKLKREKAPFKDLSYLLNISIISIVVIIAVLVIIYFLKK